MNGSGASLYIYILVMALTTYFIRMIPLTLIRGKIRSRLIRSFLYYVPYVTLGAMTVPAIFYATSHPVSGAAGFVTALVLAYRKKSLLFVAAAASLAVFLVELIPGIGPM